MSLIQIGIAKDIAGLVVCTIGLARYVLQPADGLFYKITGLDESSTLNVLIACLFLSGVAFFTGEIVSRYKASRTR